ncbi:MAG: deoxyhypusine synthase [Candidatus Woesearchaeota archaeon]
MPEGAKREGKAKKPPEDVILKDSQEPEGLPEVKGFDFSKSIKDFDIAGFLQSYASTGFQATHLAKGIEIIKEMRKENATIFLAYTSNMASSGLRDIIAWLVKNRLVDVLVTTAGGVEEDAIKCLKPFLIGDFECDDEDLREKGINRIGNILVPNDRYIEFEKLMNPFFERLHRMQEENGRGYGIISASDFIRELGSEIDAKVEDKSLKDKSILYWAAKNEIPVFCPPLTDGSIGDMLYFYKKKNPDFRLDMSDDVIKINDIALNSEKTGVIALGGGTAKHHAINANLFREGTDYAVYVCTGTEGDGSIAGARPKEGKAWGKIKADATEAHIEGDATIIFPLLVLGGFKNE